MMVVPMEFELGGHAYKAGRLDAMTQLHVVRRLAPILTTLRAVAEEGAAGAAAPEAVLQRAVEALGDVSDNSVEYVIARCMERVQRKIEGDRGWVPAWNKAAGKPQFDDIGGFHLLTIASRVVMNELGPFFEGLASSLTGGSPA